MFNSWLELCSNLLYFEKLYHTHQPQNLSQLNTSENIEENSKTNKIQPKYDIIDPNEISKLFSNTF